jgi:hypothetical protein
MELLGSPAFKSTVDVPASYTQAIGQVIERRIARPFSVSIHLDSHRDGVPVGRHHLDAEQHAMDDLPGGYSPVRRRTAAQSRLLESRGVANALIQTHGDAEAVVSLCLAVLPERAARGACLGLWLSGTPVGAPLALLLPALASRCQFYTFSGSKMTMLALGTAPPA